MTVRPAWAATAWLGDPRGRFVDGVRLLLRTAQGLPMIGWEVSCRISPSGVSSQRLLMGLPTLGVAPSRLYGMLDVLGMPGDLAAPFLRDLSNAHQILVAVDAQPEDLEIRAYQLFDHTDQSLAMRGYKWMTRDTSRHRITDYRRSDKTWSQVIAHYAQHGQTTAAAADTTAYKTALTIARLAAARTPMQRKADFLLAHETTGRRASSCLRLYETGLQFRHILEPISELLLHWGLASERARVLSVMTTRPLGWIAVGDDANGLPFLTLYGQAALLDARRLMAQGAMS